jgi:lysylphosphatidylglycerol synthetase-like protein (DUF2156 family)
MWALTIPLTNGNLYAQAPDGRIEAFVVFLPYRGGTAYMADVTRRRPDAVYGAIQMVITQAFAKFREEGIRRQVLASLLLGMSTNHGNGKDSSGNAGICTDI